MFAKWLILVYIVAALGKCCTTRVQKCNTPGGNIDENSTIDNQVFISGCDEPPCKFNKNSSMSVDIYFEPDYDVSRLTNNVYAWVFAIPFPYLGVDGTSACGNLFQGSKRTKITCPIRKGQRYLYKNTVEIKASYPKVKVILHWALLDAKNNAQVFCFEVPVKIIS